MHRFHGFQTSRRSWTSGHSLSIIKTMTRLILESPSGSLDKAPYAGARRAETQNKLIFIFWIWKLMREILIWKKEEDEFTNDEGTTGLVVSTFLILSSIPPPSNVINIAHIISAFSPLLLFVEHGIIRHPDGVVVAVVIFRVGPINV